MMKFILLVTATACGTSVSYAPFRTMPVTRPVAAASVEVFYTPPRCPFIELGMLESQTRVSDLNEGLFEMRKVAAVRGADAIILIDHQDSAGHRGNTTTHSSRAIAIMRDQSCVGDLASQYVGQPYSRGYVRPSDPR